VGEPFRWRDYRGLDSRIWVLAGARAVNTMGLSLAMAFMAIHLVRDRGLPATVYGGIFLIANLCQSLAQGYAGELSDRLGRRGLMRFALFTRSFVVAGLGLEILASVSVWIIAATLVLSSTLRGLFEPVAYAAVADIAKPRERVAAFGLQRMGTNLGWALGPAIGGALSEVLSYGAIFFLSAPTLLIAGYAASRIAEPVRSEERDVVQTSLVAGLREAGRRADVTVLLACAFLASVVHMQLFATLSIYNSDVLGLSNGDIGLIYTLNGCIVLLVQIPAIGLIERLGNHRSLIVGAILYVASFLAIGAAAGWLGMAFAVAILTLGEVVLAPAQQAVVAEVQDPKRMGRAFGLLGLLQMLGVAIAPILGGIAYDHLKHDGMALWSLLAVLPAALTAGYVGLARLRQPRMPA